MKERIEALNRFFTELKSIHDRSKSSALAADLSAAGGYAEEALAALARIKGDLPHKEREPWVAMQVNELEKSAQMIDARFT